VAVSGPLREESEQHMKVPTLWDGQEHRKTLPEAIEETIAAFTRIDAWQYAIWNIGYSGGKDSTALVTLLAHLIVSGRLPRSERIVVQYADTGMVSWSRRKLSQ
jgi:3'-phosphoadenosine 5'-phosphosulfate sulfotransferase (PAPS reductase)/FAD synthetase